jgi:hypothetical protein
MFDAGGALALIMLLTVVGYPLGKALAEQLAKRIEDEDDGLRQED